MAYKFPPFTKQVGDSLVYNDEGTFCFYVPDIYFDRKNAIQDGEIVHLFGIVDWTIMKNGKHNGLHRFVLPTMFQTQPTRQSKIKNVKLVPESDPADYMLFEYDKGAPIFVNVGLTQDVENIEEFFKVIKSGRLPTTLPYDKFQDYMYDAFIYGGTKYSLHSQLIGVVASRYFRDPKNIREEFRHTDMKKMTGYKLISVNDIPKYVSPYASITSENWQSAVVGALTIDDGPKSPLEKMLMEAAGLSSL
jgi:hypothetical protein